MWRTFTSLLVTVLPMDKRYETLRSSILITSSPGPIQLFYKLRKWEAPPSFPLDMQEKGSLVSNVMWMILLVVSCDNCLWMRDSECSDTQQVKGRWDFKASGKCRQLENQPFTLIGFVMTSCQCLSNTRLSLTIVLQTEKLKHVV